MAENRGSHSEEDRLEGKQVPTIVCLWLFFLQSYKSEKCGWNLETLTKIVRLDRVRKKGN